MPARYSMYMTFLWTHHTNVVPVVEEVGKAVEVGKCLVGRGEQGERPFPSQAAAQAGSRHGANQGAEPATAKRSGLEKYSTCMDQITIKTPNPKCRLYWCFFHSVYRLEIQSVMLVFSTPFVN